MSLHFITIYSLFSVSCANPSSLFALPPRGWTSWDLSAITNNAPYGREWLTETTIFEQSEALASNQVLLDASFQYINIDSFWAADPTQTVDEYGRWTYNTTRFPNGIRAVADHVHAQGLKLGIYLDPGVAVAAVKQSTPILNGVDNCTAADIAVYPYTGGNTFWDCYKINWTHPCSFLYIQSMADLIASTYQVDLLKMDAVSPGSDTSQYDNREDIEAWSQALQNTGRGDEIWFSLSWNLNVSYALTDWGQAANSARVETMVSWSSVYRLFAAVAPWLEFTNAGVILPDLDSIDVCGQGTIDGLTLVEKQSAVTLWSITGGPYITGNDLTRINGTGLDYLTRPELLSIHSAGVSALIASGEGIAGPQIWAINYHNGTFIAALFNLGETAAAVECDFTLFVGARRGSTFALEDIWERNSLGNTSASVYTSPALPVHGVQLLRMDVV